MKQKSLLTLFIILFSLTVGVQAENILQIHDATAEPFDTLAVDIEIINADPFVAFQFDLPLPAQFTYVANSVVLTGREVDHTITADIIAADTLRILSYSPSNTPFLGNNGNVASFKLVAGSQIGTYELSPLSAVISDPNSQNILSQIINGTIQIEPNTAIDEQEQSCSHKFSISTYPNPFSQKTKIELNLGQHKSQENLSLLIFNSRGQFINRLSPLNSSDSCKNIFTYTWQGYNYQNRQVATGVYILQPSFFTNNKEDNFQNRTKLLFIKR